MWDKRGLMEPHMEPARGAEDARPPLALRGAQLRVPCHGFACSAPAVTISRVLGRGGLSELGPDHLPHLFQTHSQGRVYPRKL